VSHLVFSLDTLDHAKADAWYGVGPGALARILANIDAAAREPGRDYEIVVSAVITPDNLDDLDEVYAFARRAAFASPPARSSSA